MKILFLGDSNDGDGRFTSGERRIDIVARRLKAELGEPVEIIAKPTWPDGRMLAAVERWLATYTPDVVYLNVVSYPFVYESVPLRLRRVLGPLGPAVSDAGFRFAESKRWAYNPVFRTVRRWAQATIGGDTHFPVDEVVETLSSVIRRLARDESLCVVVKGPGGAAQSSLTQREARRKEAKRQRVHQALRDLCGRLHVDYTGFDTQRWKDRPRQEFTVGDSVHFSAAGHAEVAEGIFVSIRNALARQRAGSEAALAR